MQYAIETRNLIKRYPTTARRGDVGFGGHGRGGGISSITGIYDILRPHNGPYIEALKGINLQIKRGEIFGILGPNGAGKTTLIKILCTLVIHDEGEVLVNGYDPRTQTSEVLKNLQAVLPESRGFSWRLSGRQNLEFYGLLYGLKDQQIKERVDYLLDFTGLKERADDGYQRYSTGMQRRLLLCRALLRDTPIIVFDEPTTGLDPTGAAEFRDLLIHRLAREEGKTILLSTHNLEEAQLLCDRIAILERGRILACDTPDAIRYLRIEDRVFKAFLSEGATVPEALLNELKSFPGIHDLKLINGTNGAGFSLRVPKDSDIAPILFALTKSGLPIRSVSTEEPTLEDAFIAITGKMPAGAEQPRSGGGMGRGGMGGRR